MTRRKDVGVRQIALFAKLPAALRLELIEARGFECGVVVHLYRPRND